MSTEAIVTIVSEAIHKLSLDLVVFESALETAQEDLTAYVLDTALTDVSKLQTTEYVNTIMLKSLRVELLSTLLLAVHDKQQELSTN